MKKCANKAGSRIDFITFNYTEVLDVLLNNAIKRQKNPYSLIHIHGKLSDNDMVLGADNEGQVHLSQPLTRSGKRSLIKPVLLENYDSSRMEDAMHMLEHASVIVVFGMSLGESDLI